MNTNDILAALGKVGKLFYDTMIGKLDAGNYPPGDATRKPPQTSIQSATSVVPPEQEGNTLNVKIKIDLTKAPYAQAYEEGSGVHGPEGKTYPIVPKASKDMVFPEGDWPNFVPGLTRVAPNKNGLFFLTHVEHPGVEKKPYIAPTIKEIDPEVRKILAREFKVSWLREAQK
jgi:hypothetical protein